MSKRRHPAVERELDDLVFAALQADGRLMPVTPDEVARAEEELLETASGKLPPFDSVVRGHGDGLRLMPRPIGPNPLVEETLARAARDGANLPPDVEAAMHRDRDAAEAEADAGDDA